MAVEILASFWQHLSWKGIGQNDVVPCVRRTYIFGPLPRNFVEVGLCTLACNMNFSFSGLLQPIDKPFINDSHKRGKLVIYFLIITSICSQFTPLGGGNPVGGRHVGPKTGPSDPRKEQAKQEFESLATLSEDPCLTNWSRSMASNGDTIDTIHGFKNPQDGYLDTIHTTNVFHRIQYQKVASFRRERVPCVRKPALRRSRPFDIKPQPWKL